MPARPPAASVICIILRRVRWNLSSTIRPVSRSLSFSIGIFLFGSESLKVYYSLAVLQGLTTGPSCNCDEKRGDAEPFWVLQPNRERSSPGPRARSFCFRSWSDSKNPCVARCSTRGICTPLTRSSSAFSRVYSATFQPCCWSSFDSTSASICVPGNGFSAPPRSSRDRRAALASKTGSVVASNDPPAKPGAFVV